MVNRVLLNTIQDNNNIGNRLQNYALQTVLEKFDIDVVNIDNGYTRKPGKKETLKNILKGILGYLGCKEYKDKYVWFCNRRQRRIANEAFSKRRIHNIFKVTYSNVFKMNWEGYDMAIVGSDQVWHKWRKDPLELSYYYLEFFPENKRASYAASFGFEEFPEIDKENHINGIRGMRYISCREQSGCQLVNSITGETAIQVLDPTLLLSAKDWRQMETDVSDVINKGERYVFLYFLGKITEEYQKYINKISNESNLRIINFLDFTNNEISKCGVEEFITLIDQAEYVLTDSFHCTVFSILFDKEFTVFKRVGEGFEHMYSRIDELLQITGKSSKSYYKIKEKKDLLSFQDMYDKSYEYLKKILI